MVQVPIIHNSTVWVFLKGCEALPHQANKTLSTIVLVLEISPPRTTQTVISVSFQVQLLHLCSPWTYEEMVCKKLTKPHAEGHSDWSWHKASLWEQARVARKEDTTMVVPRGELKAFVFQKVAPEATWTKGQTFSSLSEQLREQHYCSRVQRTRESALANQREKIPRKKLVCFAEPTSPRCSLWDKVQGASNVYLTRNWKICTQ